MRFLFLQLFFLISPLTVFSQEKDSFLVKGNEAKRIKLKNFGDSLKKVNHHMVGAGIQFMRGKYRSLGHYERDLYYSYPQWNVFYRYQVVRPSAIHAFNFLFSQYFKWDEETNGGLGGRSTDSYDLSVFNLELGYTYFWRNSDFPNISLGISPNLDLRFETGTIRKSGWSSATGVLVTTDDSYRYNRFYVMPSGNMEFQYKFLLKDGASWALGVRTGFWRRYCLYVAYNFK
jgi:hypothetical protein